MRRLVCLILAVCLCLTLTGCDIDYSRYLEALENVGASSGDREYVPYEEMVYSRPDMLQLEEILQSVCAAAAAGQTAEEIVKLTYDFYDAYDLFYTNYYLADLRYSADLTDEYWKAETDFCTENSAWVDGALEELYYALAKSSSLEELEGEDYFGPGFFDSYQGENNWDAGFTALLEQEAALVSRYYDLSARGAEYAPNSPEFYDACAEEMGQVLVDLIRLRRDIAEYWGYEDYCAFASDFYYYRDYTVEQSGEYLAKIRQELVELYRQVNGKDVWNAEIEWSSEERTYDYVVQMARNMGGRVEEAFSVMEQGGYYDIGYGENKYPASFEVYLTSYQVPFVFMNPEMSTYDHLTFAHEFGHFCCDYSSWGSYAGVDVLEVFSQGMEYLSLCYAGDGADLTRLKMADCLYLYIEQAAFAEFEMEMYRIPEEKLSVQALTELYDRVALDYGFDSVGYDAREYVTINHYYTNPMYVISYVVSNDAALQLYQLEQRETGLGLEILQNNLDTQERYFLAFLDAAGLKSPFTPGRLEAVRQTLESMLS